MTAVAKSKRATVFGGTGFLGRAIVARLAADGAGVRIAARRPEAGDPPAGVEVVAADLRDPAYVERAVAVDDAGSVVLSVDTTFWGGPTRVLVRADPGGQWTILADRDAALPWAPTTTYGRDAYPCLLYTSDAADD